ncbi:hypothetical protein ACQPZ8_29355 [Actinomadura nitritigenes]|uniref:hypothetical protein n=1 Tax=Actinomadura nitritigenes TaxID=134602 RepID=UPI003D8A16E3
MQERGGGLTTALAHNALAALSARYGTDDLDLTDLRMDSRRGDLTVRVRDSAHPGQLDELTFSDGHLSKPSPVMVRASDDLDAQTFPVHRVTALGRVEQVFDTALAGTRYPGAVVQTIEVTRGTAVKPLSSKGRKGRPVPVNVVVSVTSPRAQAQVVFDADGRAEKVIRQ